MALPAILESRGFRVNLSKTQIYNPDGRAPGAQALATHHGIGYAEEGIVLVGVPMSSQHHHIHARLDDQLLSLKQKAKRILEYAKHTEEGGNNTGHR